MKTPDNIKIGIPFKIEKGNRIAWYKIIEHPYFDAFALIADHPYLRLSLKKEDEKHIIYGGNTIQKAWESAYSHT